MNGELSEREAIDQIAALARLILADLERFLLIVADVRRLPSYGAKMTAAGALRAELDDLARDATAIHVELVTALETLSLAGPLTELPLLPWNRPQWPLFEGRLVAALDQVKAAVVAPLN